MLPKLIIFDLDGVLVDACDIHKMAFIQALYEDHGRIVLSDYHDQELNGLPTRVKLEKLGVDRSFHQRINDLKQEKTIQLIEQQVKPYQPTIELLGHIYDQGIRIACYTNSIRKTARLMLRRAGVRPFIDVLLCSEDVSKSKPDPEGYIKIREFYNLDPRDVVIVEDSEKGIQAAIQSRCQLMRVTGPSQVDLRLWERIMIL